MACVEPGRTIAGFVIRACMLALPPRTLRCASDRRREICRSFVEDRNLERTNALGIGNHIDRGDLPARDRELKHPLRPPIRGPQQPNSSIDERNLSQTRVPSEARGDCRRTPEGGRPPARPLGRREPNAVGCLVQLRGGGEEKSSSDR